MPGRLDAAFRASKSLTMPCRMADRLPSVLARCERIRLGFEGLPQLPPPLAERLRSLYAKAERLRCSEPVLVDESSEEERASTDPYLWEAEATPCAPRWEAARF